jgi:uncharacterized membrane protein
VALKKRVELKHIPVRPANPFLGWQRKAHNALTALFVAELALVWVRLWIPGALLGTARWPDGLLLVLAAATTLASVSRQLPAQNVVLAATVIGIVAGCVATLNAFTAVPFGPIAYNRQNIGQLLFYPLPWAIPVMWVVVILTARGVARLMLRRYRSRANYGFQVIGLAAALTALFDLSMEPYAILVREYWEWKPTKLPSDWYTAPWVNFLGWAVTTLVILLFVTPALINKSPVKSPPAYHSLLVWELLSLLFLTGTYLHHLLAGSFLILGQMAVVCFLSLLGAKGGRKSAGSVQSGIRSGCES